MAVRIGISGWTYAGWRGVFYPRDLPRKRELEYAAQRFNTIEINGTFYRLQTQRSFARWYEAAPPDFEFAVKGSRFITHMKQLRDVREPLANFFASGVLRLEEKLGPILWQFSPRMRLDDRFEQFLKLLPASTGQAARIARGHGPRVRDPWTRTRRDRPIRHAIEIRDESFFIPEFMDMLRHYRAALVFSDAADWTYVEDVTADFIYARLHGSEALYTSGYDDESLARWAAKIRRWQRGSEPPDAQRIGPPPVRRARRDVYVYFDNDAKVRAPFDAMRLIELLRSGEKRESRAA